MHTLLENIFTGKELYKSILSPICHRYGLTHTEMSILLFLAAHPEQNTATNIVQKRRMTKSSISMSLRNLQERQLISNSYAEGNRRTIYLNISEAAQNIVNDAFAAQEQYFSILTQGFSEEEVAQCKTYFDRISLNIRNYYKDKKIK